VIVGLFRKTYSDYTDEQLMSYLSMGDKNAFDELYQRYAKLLFHYFKRCLWKDKEKAEDFIHDLFAKIIDKPKSFDATRSFKTWIYSVANNMCKNEYKKQEVRKVMVGGVDNSYVPDKNTNLVSEVQDLIFGEAFENKLNKMDEKHREAFRLRHIDGLSIKEIAEVLSINEGTIKSRIFYATKYLADHLKEYNPIYNK
jgi:RNA polymerase sigma-70 factor, ECF subfamily